MPGTHHFYAKRMVWPPVLVGTAITILAVAMYFVGATVYVGLTQGLGSALFDWLWRRSSWFTVHGFN